MMIIIIVVVIIILVAMVAVTVAMVIAMQGEWINIQQGNCHSYYDDDKHSIMPSRHV